MPRDHFPIKTDVNELKNKNITITMICLHTSLSFKDITHSSIVYHIKTIGSAKRIQKQNCLQTTQEINTLKELSYLNLQVEQLVISSCPK